MNTSRNFISIQLLYLFSPLTDALSRARLCQKASKHQLSGAGVSPLSNIDLPGRYQRPDSALRRSRNAETTNFLKRRVLESLQTQFFRSALHAPSLSHASIPGPDPTRLDGPAETGETARRRTAVIGRVAADGPSSIDGGVQQRQACTFRAAPCRRPYHEELGGLTLRRQSRFWSDRDAEKAISFRGPPPRCQTSWSVQGEPLRCP